MLTHPNAKINIGLNVIEKRADGYHNLETIFYPIGLCDVLEVQASKSCTDYSFSSSGIDLGNNPEDNLIIKAYRSLQFEYEIPPIDISLIKQIPFGAGLGGGSSDAAFMLKTLNELFELKITTRKLEKIAAEIGADCPVFIKNKPVYATGIGNVFQPIKLSLKGNFLVLIKPEIHISTPEAYAMVIPQTPEVSLFENIKRPKIEWKNYVKNDFELSIFSKYPEIEAIKNTLYDMGAIYASMSGSGSAVYGIFENIPEMKVFDKCFVTGGYLD